MAWLSFIELDKAVVHVSGPITSWQTDGETMKTVADFIFGGSKITADGDCSHEEIPHIQGKRNPSKMVGVVRGHQRADTLKP